ncbi:MAG: formyltransferase family protein [Bacteroidota bacterium]
MNYLKLGVLASGNLGLTCILKLLESTALEFVYTDKHSAGIINICTEKNIPVFIGNPRKEKAELFIKRFDIDVLLSINYLYLVNSIIYGHPRKFAVNFHGSLLPKYRGRTPHVWAIINNEQQTGITAHLMTGECDEGDILYQEVILIDENDTGADILKKYEKRYPDIVSSIIIMIEDNLVNLLPQNNMEATYFGKRVPDDGLINWDWQRERIKNWVRAQAKPYPGAFSYIKNNKVVIHKIEFSNLGFFDTDPNGKIISIDELIVVKTPNGAVKLTDIEIEHNINIVVGDIFCESN